MDDLKPKQPAEETPIAENVPEASIVTTDKKISVTDVSSDSVAPIAEAMLSATDTAPEVPANAPTPQLETPIEETSTTVSEGLPAEAIAPQAEPEPAAEIPADPAPAVTPVETAAAAIASAAPLAANAKKKSNPMVMIIVAVVLVVIALGVVAYFAFGKKDSPVKSSSNSSTATQTATAKDPDTASTIIDESLAEIDDSNDYGTTTLSDSTLGL